MRSRLPTSFTSSYIHNNKNDAACREKLKRIVHRSSSDLSWLCSFPDIQTASPMAAGPQDWIQAVLSNVATCQSIGYAVAGKPVDSLEYRLFRYRPAAGSPALSRFFPDLRS